MIYRNSRKKVFEEWDKPDFRKHSGNIILWGAGKLGGVAAHVLKQQGIEFIAFCDGDSSKHGSSYCDHNIISPETLYRNYSDAVVIVTTVARLEVLELLQASPVDVFFDAWSLFLDIDFKGYSDYSIPYITRMLDYYFRAIMLQQKIEKQYVAERLRIVVTNKCTLRCVNCVSFTPYSKVKRNYEWQALVHDVLCVIDAIGYLEEVVLYGGEALLHPEIDNILNALRHEKRISTISLSINATVLPKKSTIMALREEPRAHVVLSNYGELSCKYNEFVETLLNNDISFEEINYQFWYEKSEIGYLNETDEERKRKFINCMSGCGLVIWDGKLFLCQTLPFLLDLDVFPHSDDNYIDVGSSGNMSREELNMRINNFANRANTHNYVDACKYCTGKTSSNFLNAVPVAEQATGALYINKVELSVGNEKR